MSRSVSSCWPLLPCWASGAQREARGRVGRQKFRSRYFKLVFALPNTGRRRTELWLHIERNGSRMAGLVAPGG
jgi:hypothetical protein